MKRIFICSRYAGDTVHNEAIAECLCRKVIEAGHAPFAPHLLYPRFLADHQREERELGVTCGLLWLAVCDELWAYTEEGVSDGMRRELAYARARGIPVVEVSL